MAQYKASMDRMFRPLEEDPTQFLRNEPEPDASHHPLLNWLEQHAKILLLPVLPLCWCVLLVCTMTREMMLDAYAMPLLGISSALLANAVPVGGGIVFVPVLGLFGIDIHLGAAFAVATMTFGNGVFGFLTWLQKDPSSIAWRIVPYAVIPAWLGATWATFYPFLTPHQCRHLFALSCLKVAVIVGRGIYIGQRNTHSNTSTKNTFSLIVEQESEDHDREEEPNPLRRKMWASACSFLTGSVLVSHIGIGNAMTTFLVGSFIWRLPAKTALVTGILCGGWTSVLPFLLHLFVFRDVPIALWVMGLPGVYVGAQLAPLVHELLGITTVLMAFCGFLVVTAIIMV
jgi:uncharacterized membrane protein YfcA